MSEPDWKKGILVKDIPEDQKPYHGMIPPARKAEEARELDIEARLRSALIVAKRSILEDKHNAIACTVWVPDDVSPSETLVDHIDSALSAPAAPSQDRGVRVKALAWENGESRSPLGDLYEVRRLSDIVWQTLKNGIAFPGWSDEACAKAAAQADYERRILAALEDPAPAPADGVEEVLRDARKWVEANTAQVRGLSAEAAAPGEAMLARIDAALSSLPTAKSVAAPAGDLLTVAKRIRNRGYVSVSIEEKRDVHLALVAAIENAETAAPTDQGSFVLVLRSEILDWAKEFAEREGDGETDCVTPFDKYLYAHTRDDAARVAEIEGGDDYALGKRDGYEEAVQHIDERTGGDGEYVAVVGYDAEGRNCPDAPSMIAKIVLRFEATEARATTAERNNEQLKKELNKANLSVNSAYASMRQDNDARRKAEQELNDARTAYSEKSARAHDLEKDRDALRESCLKFREHIEALEISLEYFAGSHVVKLIRESLPLLSLRKS